HGGGGFFQRRRLRQRALGQVVIARRDLAGRRGDVVGGATHLRHDADEAAVHFTQGPKQLLYFVGALRADFRGEVARSNGEGGVQRGMQRSQDAARDQHGQPETQQCERQLTADQHPQMAVGGGGALFQQG